jgi:hypothetical protein
MNPTNSRSQVTLPAPLYHAISRDSFAPAESWALAVTRLLLERGHDIELVLAVLAHARAWGSVEYLELLGDDDRAAVEDLLPEAPIAHWAKYPERWTLAEQHSCG